MNLLNHRVPSSVTLLVAEDDEDDRLLMAEAFEELDASVVVDYARDGLELLGMLDRYQGRTEPLVLLDLNMPRMDGREVLQAVRADPHRATIPIVVLSTSDQPDEVDAVYGLGANTFFTKPARFEELVSLLGALVDYWQHRALLPSSGAGSRRGGGVGPRGRYGHLP